MLDSSEVVAVYKQVLGREPSSAEVDDQLRACPRLEDLLRIVLESEEYAARQLRADVESARAPTRLNFFHPDLARWAHPPGTRSEDGAAIVGREGCLFLSGGSNANLDQHLGAVQMGPEWLEGWRRTIARRADEMEALGVASALLVVPDKLAVYEDLYPDDLDRVGPRPVESLLAAPDLPIVYPIDDLLAARSGGEEIHPRTDTHFTFRGNELLFESVATALGIERLPDHSDIALDEYAMAGDLGIKFEPPIVSIVREPGSLGAAEVAEDNREEFVAVGAHIGTRRVFSNPQAADPRVAVVFGDSFAFAGPRYQGATWFLAQVFRETHFIWVPFGWDAAYVRRVGAEAVLVQGAERFAGRVPHVDVDSARIAEQTLRGGRPLGVEQVSS
jgi:alginate O-acetyltransferase complex protein AlgJ